MAPEDLLQPTPAGLCCPAGGFYIDPTRPVDKALITHGHSDHARPGHKAVLATRETLDLMRLRYGENLAHATQAIDYGEKLKLGGASVSFHPAGHVLGSAQILVEANGCRIVASGDYKDVADPTCRPFELVRCDVLAIPRPKSASCCARSRCSRSGRISSAAIHSARCSA
jgi:putative mRNA 3-end processing factor